MNNLAVVIPAFKPEYFQKTLLSIENQTCKDFHLYIGDDNSPYDLESIVKSTLKTVDYTYKKFPDNLGSTDLVAQWERCIDLKNDEEWIWLFSDDDRMHHNGVELLCQELKKNEFKLYKFNRVIINEQGEVLRVSTMPDTLNILDYLNYYNDISMPEFVFHRSLHEKFSIVSFPLAWYSDISTWLLYISEAGSIKSIPNGYIDYRYSSEHISGDVSKPTQITKTQAAIKHVEWLNKFKTEKAHRAIGLQKLIDVLIDQKIWLLKNSTIHSFNCFVDINLLFYKVFSISKAIKESFSLLRLRVSA